MIKVLLVAGTLFLGANLSVCAQDSVNDSLQLAAIIEATKTIFIKSLGFNSRLYEGFEYNIYSYGIKGSPYFQDSLYFQKGQVVYHNVIYNDVPLLYDVYQDQLVSYIGSTAVMYSFVKDDLQSFSFGGHLFLPLKSPSLKSRNGYFEVLYDKKIGVFAKKTVSKQNAPGSSESFFDSTMAYYLRKDEKCILIGSLAELLRQLKDKKEELNQYIKREHLKFGTNQGESMVRVIIYYESLTK